MMVYKFQCQYDADYSVRTTKRLGVRVKQHVPRELYKRSQETTLASSQAEDLAICDHLCELYICWTNSSDDRLSVLHKARCNKHLVILKGFAMTLFYTSLCRQRRQFYSLFI